MAKSSSYWDKRALRRLSDAEKTSEIAIARIKRIYEQAYKNIDKDIANVYRNYAKDTGLDVQKLKELLTVKETDKMWKQLKKQGLDQYVKQNYKSRISRLEQIQAQIYAKAKLIYPKEELEQTMCYKSVIHDSYYKAVYDTQMGTGFNFAFSKIDNNTITALLNDKWSGLNYSRRIWGNTDILATSVSKLVGGAMLSGQSIEKTTKQLRDRFNVSEYYARRLVRTETNHFNNEADALAYEEMGIDKYVFVATLDSKTSDMCQSMDNKVFEYKDKEVGVNYPPLHPNCRSKTRGYLGEEAEKGLKRRARNPLTGKTEVIPNMSYSKWAEKYEIAKPKRSKKLEIEDLPKFMRTPKELESSKILIDRISQIKDANPKVLKLYKGIGTLHEGMPPVKLTHARGNSLKLNYKNNKLVDVKLTIPKLTDYDNPTGAINTTLHELMHYIDYMKAGNNVSFMSTNFTSLRDVIANTDDSMSEDIQMMFELFNKTYKNNRQALIDQYAVAISEYGRQMIANEITFKDYKSLVNKANKERDFLIGYEGRNIFGGGINNLQDIYDALSKGKYFDNNTVTYGHGSRYYRFSNAQIKEIVAQYSTLSITRPDLIEMLKADKPALVKELDKFIDSLIGG